MKKMKKALFAVLAAFSLSACDFDIQKLPGQVADTVGGWINSVKDLITGGGEKEKEKEEEEEQPCEHQDANHDGVCDLCGEQGLVVTHTDANNDHLCDVCGAEVSQCKDDNHDHICDICGATVSAHVDADADFKCDICGADLKVTEIQLDTSEAVLEFGTGESFSSAGVKVVATSEVGSTQEIEFTTSQPDMSVAGDQEVVVTYLLGGEEHSFVYTIHISTWSEEDLYYFELLTDNDFTYLGYCGLPYMAGSDMKLDFILDEEGYIEDFYVVANNVTSGDYLRYLEALENYSYLMSGKYYFEFETLANVDTYGYFDLTDATVVRLAPVQLGSQYNMRLFDYDEYFVLGFKDDQFIIKNKWVNAIFESNEMANNPIADGTMGWSAYAKSILGDFPGFVKDYFSELSSLSIVTPDVDDTNGIYPLNYHGKYPFLAWLEDYAFAMRFIITGTNEKVHDDFEAALLENKFVLQDKEEDDQTSNVYLLESEYLGSIEYTVYPYFEDEDGGNLVYDFFYIAPESYTTVISADIDALLTSLQVDSSTVEISNDNYLKKGYSDVSYARELGEGTLQSVFTTEMSALAQLGYEFTEAAAFTEATEDEPAYWSAKLTDYGTFSLSVVAYESKGYVVFEYEITKYFSFTLEDVYKAAFGSAQYSANEEGNMVAVYGGDATLTSVIMSAKNGLDEVGIIDYTILNGGSGSYYFFSGVTKDRKLIYTVYAYAVEGGIALEVDAEELSYKEAIIRDILPSFSQYGAFRHYNYDVYPNSYVSELKWSTTGIVETLIRIIYSDLPESFEIGTYDDEYAVEVEGADEPILGYHVVFTDGSVNCDVVLYENGGYTYATITVEDRPA